MLVVGIDSSTTSTKAVLFDEKGQVRAHGEAGYPVEHPNPGWAEQQAEWWWTALIQSFAIMLNSAPSGSEKIGAIAITHQRYSFVGVDRHLHPTHPAILWCDNRCAEEAEWVTNKLGRDAVYAETGYAPYVWAVYKILWLKRHEPEVYAKTYKWMLVQDYLIHRLTGELATTSSSAVMMGCLDIGNPTRWANGFLAKIDIDTEKFIQRIEPAGSLLGKITNEAAESLGISGGIPIFAAAGDQPCGCIGAGVCETQMVGINGGTSCTIQGITEEIPKGTYHFVVEINPIGKYAPEVAIHSGVSMIMKWLRDRIVGDASISWETLYGLAGKAPVGNLGLLCVPYFQGVEAPYWDPGARGLLFGLGIQHGIEHMVRACIEGLAYETRFILELMAEGGGEGINDLRMYGGSAVSDIWNQTFASVTCRPVRIPVTEQATALGAAMCAAAGLGFYKSVEEASRNMVSMAKEYLPVESDSSIYSEVYGEVYRPLYDRIKDLMHGLARIISYP
jgi:sugar (pentulose or hexulose) kinase